MVVGGGGMVVGGWVVVVGGGVVVVIWGPATLLQYSRSATLNILSHPTCTHLTAHHPDVNINRYEINGVKEDEAFIKWWKSDGEPAADHWSLPCELSETAPHQCNPSCDGKAGKAGKELAGCDPDDLMCQ